MLRSSKRVVRSGSERGFTLVELLIVIVVIGVLSAMMMLSSTEAVSSARASNVISNMRNIKTAVLSWYTDNLDLVKFKDDNYQICEPNSNNNYVYIGTMAEKHASDFTKYLNTDSSLTISNLDKVKNTEGAYYLFSAGTKNESWYVGYVVGSNTNLQSKIAGRAKTLGLKENTDGKKITDKDYYTSGKYVCMLIQTLQ